MSETVTTRAPRLPAGAVAIAAVFVAALVTAQLTAAKVLEFGVPFGASVPLAGERLALPGAAVAYALTFLASDCYTELYGKRAAQVLVNVGFFMNFVVLGLVWTTIAAPAADPEFAGQFATVLGASTNIVLASLFAYVVSQNYDVVVFHRLAAATGGDHLWLRNIVSTGTSQLLDTVVFVGIAFWILPQYVGMGPQLPGFGVVVSLMVGQYLLKLAIVLLDTPLVYLVTGAVRRFEPPTPAAAR